MALKIPKLWSMVSMFKQCKDENVVFITTEGITHHPNFFVVVLTTQNHSVTKLANSQSEEMLIIIH